MIPAVVKQPEIKLWLIRRSKLFFRKNQFAHHRALAKSRAESHDIFSPDSPSFADARRRAFPAMVTLTPGLSGIPPPFAWHYYRRAKAVRRKTILNRPGLLIGSSSVCEKNALFRALITW